MFEAAFDHIHLRSLDPEAAARFYVDRLGATLLERLELPDGGLRVVIRLVGLLVFIERATEAVPAAHAMPYRGLEHLGLAVPDVDRAVAAMRDAGVRILLEPTDRSPTLRIAFIEGPDGATIEFLQRG